MAAEVRNHSPTESQSESRSSLFSDPSLSPIQSFSTDCGANNSSLPSYLIVKKQIEDVILTQRAAVDQLVKYNIEIENATRESLNTTIQSQEDKIKHLEKSIVEDYVLKVAYESLQKELKENYIHKDRYENVQKLLQTEQNKHGETQAKLQEVLEKFNGCLLDIEKLEFELAEKNMTFTQAYGKLEMELSEAQAKINNYEQLVQEMTTLCERQRTFIQQKENQCLELERKNSQTQLQFEKKVRDSEVEKQQDAYMNKIFNCVDRKRKT
ncbi:myosin-3-like isoform X1 [Biomphalaria glabrata]|uniref:Myosin-3-like isoform X1 n=1 Tax=Biomphalaria glabrata TaxID=6526 RepID=A0A9U8EJI1_BIOGL|nr:myosin-3-like isoform X1 [Biomphalaria glabrata]